ncbi:hypothetical protein scyTo_0024483, partial [Scyliorhinus torazame]|nr:hypothetical protein [Scyliorhinus torazame]
LPVAVPVVGIDTNVEYVELSASKCVFFELQADIR